MSTSLKLDPGPQPRRRAKLSCCRFCLWMVLAVVGLGVTYAVYYGINFAVRFVKGPHFPQYQDLSVPYKPGDVLKPLVGSEQTFDIVATVWMLRDADEDTLTNELVEDVLYSDTVFRGLRLKDKNMKTVVNLSIPTNIFKKKELWNYDLRASFVLVPNPPSPLDYAVNYSSLIPTNIYFPPMRPVSGIERTLADKIVDSFGVIVPLLEFHHIPPTCHNAAKIEAIDNADDDNNDDDGNWDMPATPDKRQYTSTKGKSPLHAHPYVMTRTHLQILDVTDLYNRAQYDLQHKSLASKSCRQGTDPSLVSWKYCQKNVLLNSNMETRIKLRTRNPNTGGNVTEWAYSPYMTYSEVASGPLDLVPVPISRDTSCMDERKDFDIQSKMNITWAIALSGRTPPKWMAGAVAQVITPVSRNISNKTEFDIHASQATFAFLNGVVGHSYERKGHPRLLFVASLFRILTLPDYLLTFHYWFSRPSTVGISISGTAIRIMGKFFTSIRTVALPPQDKNQKPYTWPGAIIYMLIVSVIPLIMLKTITRAEVKRARGSWLPSISVCQATHAERASRRVDLRISWRTIIIAYTAVAAMLFVSKRFDINVIATEGIRPPPPDRAIEIADLMTALVNNPCKLVGNGLQIIINARHRTFAGFYKISIWISFIVAASQVFIRCPGSLFAFSTLRMILPLPRVMDLILFGVLAWQAVIYPSAAQALKEENVE